MSTRTHGVHVLRFHVAFWVWHERDVNDQAKQLGEGSVAEIVAKVVGSNVVAVLARFFVTRDERGQGIPGLLATRDERILVQNLLRMKALF